MFSLCMYFIFSSRAYYIVDARVFYTSHFETELHFIYITRMNDYKKHDGFRCAVFVDPDRVQ